MNLKEELLYSMALTEAKMKVVSAIAEEVYPAVAFQISDYRKDMGKMQDEILGNKSQVSNFNEVMHGALSRKNVVSVMVIGSMVMSACGVVVETGTVKPTEPTTSPAMTETLTPPTTTATENPTAAAVTELPTEVVTWIPTEATTEMPIITLTPEPTATEILMPTKEIKYPEFSKNYQPEFKEHYEADIYGMQIPIDLGLDLMVIIRNDTPIEKVKIAEDIIPLLGDLYLRSCHYRFTVFMKGNEKVTYEEYLELVRNGKGNIDMAVYNEEDYSHRVPAPEVMSIDPKQGFVFFLSNNKTELPIESSENYHFYLGSNSSGRLFTAVSFDSNIIEKFYSDFSSYSEELILSTLFSYLYQNALGPIVTFTDVCLQSIKFGPSCGLSPAPYPQWREMQQSITDEMIKQLDGKRGPIFEVERGE